MSNIGPEDIPQIGEEEIMHVVERLKRNKVLGDDNITIEMIDEPKEVIIPKLKTLFNICLEQKKISENWNNTVVVILFKKETISPNL